MEPIGLGDQVKDTITEFEGIVTGYTEHMNNCDRAYIQPQGLKDGKPIEGMWQDVPRLLLIAEGMVPRVYIKAKPFNNGDEVADTLSKYRGKVVGHAYYLVGCLHVGVQSPNLKEDGQPVDTCWLPIQQVKLIKAAKKEKVKPTGGGPMKPPTRTCDPR
jgi:hypothetical protein